MYTDGSGKTRLTNNPAADNLPALSADGDRIAFVSNRDGNEEIYVMDARDVDGDGNGDNLVRLTNDAAIDRFPDWSPDGNRIVFASVRAAPWKIYVMDAFDLDGDGNGDSLIRLTDISISYSDLLPQWSPDGSEIAFVSDRTGSGQIFVMSAVDGSDQVQLTKDIGQNQHPSWSPDGNRIAFASILTGNYEIYVMNADGSGQTRITNKSGNNDHLDWSPDGVKIAFRSDSDGNSEIYVVNADGSFLTNITNDPGNDGEPDWGP